MKKHVGKVLLVTMLLISVGFYNYLASYGLNIRTEADWNQLFIKWVLVTLLIIGLIIYWIKLKFDTNDKLNQIKERQSILNKHFQRLEREKKKEKDETSNRI